MLSLHQPDLRIFNDTKVEKPCSKSAVEVSKDLQKLMLRLKSDFMSADGHGVKYEELRKGAPFRQMEEQAVALRGINLVTLSEQEKMAFFINVYNALTIHGLAGREKIPSSVLDVQLFWRKTAYKIGGHIFTLDDIEHGILRGNRPHPATTTPAFKEGDPRLAYVVQKVDPRLHFALNCGAKSCPAINVYTAENLNKALDGATKSFCQQEIKLYEMRREIHASPIFQWYCGDFGSNDVQALRWTLPYLGDENRRIMSDLLYLLEEQGMVDIAYNEYDWKLNRL